MTVKTLPPRRSVEFEMKYLRWEADQTISSSSSVIKKSAVLALEFPYEWTQANMFRQKDFFMLRKRIEQPLQEEGTF